MRVFSGDLFLTLFPCRKHLSGFHQSRPPGVVWFGNLRGYLGNVRTLPVARNPCGRHRLMSMGPDIVSFRCRRWLYLDSRIAAVSCRLHMPRYVFPSAVALRISVLGGVVVYQSSCLMMFDCPVLACALRLSYIRNLRCSFASDVGCAHRPGFPRV